MEADVRSVLHHVRSLSEDAPGVPTEGPGLDGHSASSSSFYRVFRALLTERFLEQLPRVAVCVLSGRQDCGPEADLTRAVSLDLIKPLLGFVSTVRSQTCSAGPAASARVGASASGALPGLHQWAVDALATLRASGNLLATLSGLVDATLSRVLKIAAPLLQVPVDYVRLALQLGIRTPSLDDKETCEQGEALGRGERGKGVILKSCSVLQETSSSWSCGETSSEDPPDPPNRPVSWSRWLQVSSSLSLGG